MNNTNIKFVNVDLLDTMACIVEAHTQYYKSDFYADDMKHLQEAAAEQTQDNKCFLWLCRTHGSWLLNERDAFIRRTFEHNTFTFYAANHIEGILAYVVEVTGGDGGKVTGNLYALNYEQYVSHVLYASLGPSTLVMNYQMGTRYLRGDTPFTGHPDAELGALESHAYLPESREDWDYLLRLEKKNRERFILGNIGPYLKGLEAIKK